MYKKIILVVTLFLTLGSFAQTNGEGMFFGIKPGLLTNSAYFGMNKGRFSFYGGLEFFSAGGTTTYETTEYDYDYDQIMTNSDEFSVSFGVYNLYVGSNLYLINKDNLRSYISLILSKPILTASVDGDDEFDDELQDAVDNISIWGVQAGFGVEYFFSKNFSIGGEFGLRYYHVGFEDGYEETDSYWDDASMTDVYYTRKADIEVGFNTSITYTTMTLNFYF